MQTVSMTATEKFRHGLLIRLAVISFLLYAIYSWLLAPLSIILNSDIIYKGTIFPAVLYYLYSITEIFVFFYAYATVIFALFKFGFGKSIPFIAVYSGAVLFKYTSNLIATWILGGAIDLSEDVLFTPIFSLIFEIAQFCAVFVIAYSFTHIYREKTAASQAALLKLNTDSAKNTAFCFVAGEDKLFSTLRYSAKNPVFMSTVFSSVLILLVRVAMCIVNAVSLYSVAGFFAPVQFIADIAVSVAISVICFFVIMFLTKRFYLIGIRKYKI